MWWQRAWCAASDRAVGMADVDVHPRRRFGAAQLVGQLAAVDEHARRQGRADLRKVARDRVQRPLGLAHTVAGQALQQPDRVRVLRLLEHLDGVALLDDLAGVHHADPIAHGADDAEVVGDQQDRRVRLGAQPAHEVEDLGLDRCVEAGRRLVEHEQLRVAGQRHGDHDALLHAARQLVRVAVQHPLGVGDAHPPQRGKRLLQRLASVGPEDRERLGDLTADLQRRVQRRTGVLVHHRRLAGPEPAQVALGHAGHVGAADQDPPAGDHAVAREVAEGSERRRRLAAAGLADQPVGLARADVERHAAQHLARDAAHLVRQLEVLDGEGVGDVGGGRQGVRAHAVVLCVRRRARRRSSRPRGWWRSPGWRWPAPGTTSATTVPTG